MSVTGFLALLVVLASVGCASVALTFRLGLRHASERLLAAVMLGHLLILAPVYGFGALSALTPLSAIAGPLAASALVLVTLGYGLSGAALAARTADGIRLVRADFARFTQPISGRPGSSRVMLWGFTSLVIWLTLACYLAPSYRAYDAPWYHEPMIAFAIQERGLHVPELPHRLFYVGGLPRGSEFMSAWFILVSGSRALIELPSIIGLATLWLGVYRLARLVGARRYRAIGGATVVVLTPGLLAYAQSTYVDLHACAMLTATACFALTRPVLAGALLTLIAGGLALSMKLYALAPGALLVAIALVRAYPARWQPTRTSLTGAAALIIATAGVALATPIRNALVFGNPLYPVSITIPFSGIVLPGPIVMATRDLEMTPLWAELLRLIFQPLATYETNFAHYIEVHAPIEAAPAFNYGYAMPTLVLALAVMAIAQVFTAALSYNRASSVRRRIDLARLAYAMVFIAAVAVFFAAFPITRLARYLGFVFACVAALAAIALMGRRMRVIGDMALAAAVFMQLLTLSAQSPNLLYSPAALWRLAQMPPAERELSRVHGAFASDGADRFRDTVLSAGTIVLFGDDVLEPGPLWNRAVSNRVVYLAGDGDPTVTADQIGATSLACTRGSPRCIAVERRSDAWELVGELYPAIISQECLIYQRRPHLPAPAG